METNNFFSEIFRGKSEKSSNGLRALYNNMINNLGVPERFRDKNITPERLASMYLDYLSYGPDYDYAKVLPTVEHKYNVNGKDASVKMEQMTLADYEISYQATRVTVEKENEVVNQTVIANNLFGGIAVTKIMEYTRLMHGEEAYSYLMEYIAQCVAKLPYAPALAECDARHSANGRLFKRLFKKDPLGKQVIKEVNELDKEQAIYDSGQREIDKLNDERKIKFQQVVVKEQTPTRCVQIVQPTIPKSIVIDNNTAIKERDD